MTTERERYFATLGIIDRKGCEARAALKRAYQLRNFEIEHYWKRATYFWGFQLAVFAGFGLLWKAEPQSAEWRPMALALASLGILSGVANALSASGSRFWQENWEKHIDFLEDEFEGRLYKAVWLKNGRESFSVSRLNQYLSWYIAAFWLIVFLYLAWRFIDLPRPDWLHGPSARCAFVIGMLGLTVIGALGLWSRRSRLYGSDPTEEGSHGKPIRLLKKGRSPNLMRRYAPDETE
jgi:hypothetical protein